MSRKEDIAYLENCYNNRSNEIVVVYGSQYSGIRSSLYDFLKDKESFFYSANPCESKLQVEMICNQIADKAKLGNYSTTDLTDTLKKYINHTEEKKVIVFHNFTYMAKDYPTFVNYLISLLRNQVRQDSCMIILSSCDEYWIENDMLSFFGKSAYEIKSIIKINPLSVAEIKRKYKSLSFSELITYYSVIGGNAYLWDFYEEGIGARDFICKQILNPKGNLFLYGTQILPNDLREPTVYNTILYILSDGDVKLNDIHERTGYDRAKISVYIKNLIKRGLVEKADSIEIGNGRNIKKGIYRIKDPFVRFWYHFVFPNESLIGLITPERFFRKHIEPHFNAYRERAYVDASILYIKMLGDKGTLPIQNYEIGYYLDKNGAIDFALKNDSGRIIICACRFSQPHMAYSRLEEVIGSADSGGISYDSIYMISCIDFDQKLRLYSKVHEEVKLIDFIW